MNRARPSFALVLGAALLLGGCATTTTARFHPSETALPTAAALDQAHARKLYLLVVDGMRHDGQSRAALAYLNDYDRIYPADPKAELLRADCLLDTGQPAQAEPLYRNLVSGRYAAAANAGLGRVAAHSQDWTQAEASFQAALSLDPSHAAYVNDLGYVQLRLGQYDAALASLRQAVELQPGDLRTRNNLILGLHLAGHDADARRLIRAIPDPAQRRAAEHLLHVSAAAMAAPKAVALLSPGQSGAPSQEPLP